MLPRNISNRIRLVRSYFSGQTRLDAFSLELAIGMKTLCTSTRAVNRTIELVRSLLYGVHCVMGVSKVDAMQEKILEYINAAVAFHERAAAHSQPDITIITKGVIPVR